MGKNFKGWDMQSVQRIIADGKAINVHINSAGGAHGMEPDSIIEVSEVPRNKFGNEITAVDGIKFHSKAESQRYGELNMMLRGGLIHGFEMQVPFSLDVNGTHICKYIADFVITWPDSLVTVEDVKGVQTPEFKLKRKLMWAIHKIDIILVTSNINNNGNSNKVKKRRSRK